MEWLTALKRPIIFWQYKDSPRFFAILDGYIKLLMKYYPYEWWEFLDIDKAEGYALDLIGQRLGVPRPKDDPSSAGIYDIAEYEQAYYDYSSKDIDLVKDDVYRYMLKIRVMVYQPWRVSSVESYANALAYAFPGKSFRIYHRPGTNIVEIHAYSYMTYSERRALFSNVMIAPMTVTFLITYDYPDLRFMSDGEGNILSDGNYKIVVAAGY